MALDEATQQFLAEMAEQGGDPLHKMSPAEARAMTGALGDLYGEGPKMARVDDVEIETEDGSFSARIMVPKGDIDGVFIYYHGGGWVIGALDDFDTLGRKLANSTNCAVVMPDYRLAPEHRFPTAVEDSYAALEWTAESLEEIAGGEVPIIVGGDSAGGNLATVMALRARDQDGPEIAFQALIYPVTDADLETESYLDEENQLFLSRESMIWFWDHYVPNQEDRLEPDASPLRADSLEGLPPALVLTAEHDVLRDEGNAYAKALADAGVPVEHYQIAGQMHGFFTMVNVLPGHDKGLNLVVEATRAALR